MSAGAVRRRCRREAERACFPVRIPLEWMDRVVGIRGEPYAGLSTACRAPTAERIW
jgi:hypothetical protein